MDEQAIERLCDLITELNDEQLFAIATGILQHQSDNPEMLIKFMAEWYIQAIGDDAEDGVILEAMARVVKSVVPTVASY